MKRAIPDLAITGSGHYKHRLMENTDAVLMLCEVEVVLVECGLFFTLSCKCSNNVICN